MKTNHWKRTIAGLLAMSTLFSLSFTAVSAEETTAETTAAATTATTATTVVEIPETDMPTLSVTEEEAAAFKVTPLTIKVDGESVKGLSVSGYKGTDTDVVIPDTLIDKKGNELPVFGIADGAFSGNDTITSVKMPETVTTIGANAFSGCSSLTSVNIPDAVTTLGASAFYACTSLASIHIPESITTIDADTFCSCTSLTEIELPSTLIRIGNEAFCSSGLTSITIPEGVTQVGKEAFHIPGMLPAAVCYLCRRHKEDSGFCILQLPSSGQCGLTEYRSLDWQFCIRLFRYQQYFSAGRLDRTCKRQLLSLCKSQEHHAAVYHDLH